MISVLFGFHVNRRSIRFGIRIQIYAQIYCIYILYTYTHVGAHALARPHVVAFADIHVAFCNETVQITAARTAMHVIMNAGRLFVSVPSAGNIGHFEFSIFNALVSPFVSPSSLDVSSHPSCSSSFSSTLPPLPSLLSCRARTRERIIRRKYCLRGNSARISNFWKNRYQSEVNVRGGIERKFDTFS